MNKIIIILALTFLLTGCAFTRTVYIPYGKAVQLRETVKDVKIWAKDANGKLVPGKLDLPNGWMCLPLPSDK